MSVGITREGEAELNRVGDERTKYLGDMLGALPEADLQRLDELADIVNVLAEKYVNGHNSGSTD